MSKPRPIRAVPSDAGSVGPFCQDVKEAVETLQGARGDGSGRAVTVQDISGGSGGGSGGTIVINPGGGAPAPDLTPPPTPTGLSVAAGLTVIYISWDVAGYTQGHGHGQANIYGAKWAEGASAPTFSNAVLVGVAPNALTTYALETDASTRWAIWLKWQSADGVESTSPAGGANGQVATTGVNVDLLIKALSDASGNPQPLPFQVVTTPIVQNGVTVPVGTYITAGFISNGTITNAQIGNATIDAAKIASLNAINLTAGNGTVGGNLRSSNFVGGSAGWILQPNGYAEFSNVVIRGATYTGTIFSDSGTIGGCTINAADVRSTNFVPGSAGWRITSSGGFEANTVNLRGEIDGGAFTGYAWPASGGGFHLSPAGLLLGNVNTGQYFQVTAAGQLFMPGMSVSGGAATFSGQLSGATGTFSGSLTADAVNAVNTINIAGNAVTVPAAGELASNLNLTSSYQTLVTLNIDAGGQPIIAIAGVGIGGGFDINGNPTYQARLLINGVQERAPTQSKDNNSGNSYMCFVAMQAAPPSGSVAVTLQARSTVGGSMTALASACNVVAIGTKR